MKSRARIIVACSLVVLLLGSLFSFYGYDRTWRLWNISTAYPHFADFIAITAGAESRAQGFDPMVNNPGDPWGRRLNYPRVWQGLYALGVTARSTPYLATAIIGLFLVGICLVMPDASYAVIALVMGALLSPAVLLGVERGNTDLLMFFLVCVSVVAVRKWPVLSAMALLAGLVLKLFPIFACSVFLRLGRSALLRYALIITALTVGYVALTYSDLALVRQATPRSTGVSFGRNVAWMRIERSDKVKGECIKLWSYLSLALSFCWAFSALLREDFVPGDQDRPISLDALRAGAAIYVGTFLLGNNFDYRLMFLILTMPQMTVWVRSPARGIRACSVVVLVFTFLSLWGLFIGPTVRGLPYGGLTAFAVDEIANWIVFAGLLYLFCWSMPDWVKGYATRVPFAGRRPRPST